MVRSSKEPDYDNDKEQLEEETTTIQVFWTYPIWYLLYQNIRRFNVNLNAFIFHRQVKQEDFETSIRELKDSYRPNLTALYQIKYSKLLSQT